VPNRAPELQEKVVVVALGCPGAVSAGAAAISCVSAPCDASTGDDIAPQGAGRVPEEHQGLRVSFLVSHCAEKLLRVKGDAGGG
jgi:hypothetical protein